MKVRVVWQKDSKVAYKHFSHFLDYKQTDEMGYGKTVVISFSISLQKRIVKALNDFIAGIHYKYPICCTLNFCIDTILDRPSAQLRYSKRTEYVECWMHIKKNGKQEIPIDLY